MSNLAIFPRRHPMRSTVFHWSRLRRFSGRRWIRTTDFFQAAVALAIERPG
jgi:hypothetical protein